MNAGNATGGNGGISPIATTGTPVGTYGNGGTGGNGDAPSGTIVVAPGSGSSGFVVITMTGTPTLVATVPVGGTSTTFTGVVGTTYALTVVATIGANTSIASPSPLTSPLSAASGCILWLDGADPNNTGVPVANGTSISVWKDKSGNVNNATSASGTITVTGNSLVFDGTSKYLTVPGIAGKIVNTPFVIFIVETFAGGSGFRFYFGDDNVNNSGATERSLHIGYRSINNQTFAMYNSDLEDYSIIPQPGETRIWGLHLPGGGANRNTRRNGNVDVTFTNDAWLKAFTAPTIGRVFGGLYFNGTIAEILVFPRDIGIAAIQRVEQYLANKWKLSSATGVITPVATPTASATINAGTITVTCGTSTTGTVLNIPTTPVGLTRSSSTTTTFTYTGAAGGTNYSFLVYAYNGPATSLAASTNLILAYTPGTPTLSATGTTVNVSWTYTGSSSGVTFYVVYNTTTISVTSALNTSFQGVAGTTYTVYVYALTAGIQSANSGSASITVVGIPTFTQNYQVTTQSRIVGTVAATSAASCAGTGGGLSAPTPAALTLTWSGVTAGTRYTGVSVQGINGAATTTTGGITIYSAFSPNSIPGCQVWYDGADPAGTGTPPADGAAVSTWVNRGSGGAAFNATKYSTYSAATYSAANRALSFNTSPIAVYSTGYTGTPTVETIFIVFNVTSPSSTNNTLIGGLVAGGRGFGCGFTAAGAGTIGYLNMGVVWQSSTSGYTSGTTMIATGQLVGGKTAVSLNGGALTTPATYAAYSGGGTTYLGGQITGGSTYAYSGFAMEIIIYNRALNQSQINLVKGYLAWKWNLTNLITQLPYTSTYPIAFPLPNTYSGLALWFDSADITTLFQNTAGTTAVTANGQNVQCWRDKSGNSRHAILYTGSTGPTYSSNAFNGSYPGILFNGTTSSILMTGAFVPSGNLTATNGRDTTIFAVYNRSGTAGNSAVYGLQTTDNNFVLREPWAGATSSLVDTGGGSFGRITVANTISGAVMTSITRSAATSYFYQSTLALGSNSVGAGTVSATSQGFCIGGAVVGGPITFSSYISELIIYNAALTTAQRQSIESYLAAKWKC